MPFALDGNPTQSEVVEAVNYLLGNFPVANVIDIDTGQVVSPGGNISGYVYKYMAIKYADSYDGVTNFSNSPTNRQYYGLRNSNDATESSNPADYVWYKAAGGFGVTKFLWYISTGGRQIQLAVSVSAPDTAWLVDPGNAIDLDIVTSSTTPVIAESFVPYFAPSTLQVPRTGNPLTPTFTGVVASLYATNAGVTVPFTDAQTDTAVSFVNNSWRIGNSSTTGNADISYTNITVGNPTDGGDYAVWPIPTAMPSSPAYITVPVRYKNSAGVVSQAGVATIQYLYSDPGAAGQNSPYIDISGFTGFSVSSSGVYSPSSATLSAITTSVTSPSYSWAITNATPTSSTNSTVVVTPNSNVTSVTVTLTVSGTNLGSPISKTITLPITYDGIPGAPGANGVQSAFPSIYIWTGTAAVPTRPSTTSTYTWATGAYTAPTGWSTTAPSNTTPGNYLWQITVPINDSATAVTVTLDWTNTSYPIRCIAYNGTNGVGNPASAMFLTSDAQTFTYNSAGNADPASQTITFTANPQNLAGTTVFTATNYDSSNNPIGSPTLGGTGNTRTLAIADFGLADYCVITASLSGYSDTITVIRLQDGLNTTTGYLTNEAVTVTTDSSGGSGNYTNAGGTFKVYNGTTDVTTSSAFSATASTGLTLSINATTGVYTVTGLTTPQGTATLTAVYGGVTITKEYSISKSYAGANGVNGTRTAILDMYLWSATTPTVFPSGTSTYTWATGQFTAPATPNGWSLTPPAAVLGQTLYIARTVYADSGTSATSTVTWSATTATSISASGQNGTRTAFLEVYQWAASTPTVFPSGTSTYTWADGTFTAPSTPNSWSLTPGASTAGYKLYACSVKYSDTNTTATSTVTWSTSTAYVVGSAGTNGTAGAATFLVTRTANDSSAPTNAEVNAVIGRDPVAGDIVTVSYNNANNAVVYRYTTSWVTQATYITGSLIVENTITASKLSVSQLSAITADLGNITAGDIKVGSNPLTPPLISGTTMTGTGAHIYNDGKVAFGNATTNMVFDGSNLYLNGFLNASVASASGTNINTLSTLATFTVSKTNQVIIQLSGNSYNQITNPNITVDNVYTTIDFYIYNSSNVIVAQQRVVMNFKTTTTSLSGIVNQCVAPFSVSLMPTLAAGAYTFKCQGSQFFRNTSGTNATSWGSITNTIDFSSYIYESKV